MNINDLAQTILDQGWSLEDLSKAIDTERNKRKEDEALEERRTNAIDALYDYYCYLIVKRGGSHLDYNSFVEETKKDMISVEKTLFIAEKKTEGKNKSQSKAEELKDMIKRMGLV